MKIFLVSVFAQEKYILGYKVINLLPKEEQTSALPQVQPGSKEMLMFIQERGCFVYPFAGREGPRAFVLVTVALNI